jgi:hypothetical protein
VSTENPAFDVGNIGVHTAAVRVGYVLVASVVALALATAGSVAAADETACVGAAARDPDRTCSPQRASLSVTPDPGIADSQRGAPCTFVEKWDGFSVCAFGTPAEEAVATVGLVGDSHAAHWRGAVDVLARAHGWRGLSMMRSSCPLSKAVRDLDEPKFTACRHWKAQAFRWFAEHPEVETVFVAGLTGGSGVRPSRGRTRFATAVAGFRRAWAALPPTVKRIVVIRDTPKTRPDVTSCVARAVKRSRPPGRACATRRSASLDRDPAIAAARAEGSARVRTIDLTRYFCGPRRCYPVIGGVLVLRDQHHMTATYATTMGPFLLREADAALAP